MPTPVIATTRAMVLATCGAPLVERQLARPQVAPGEALVEVSCCTLCGSDLHAYTGRRPTALPMVLGHEIVGRVSELGPGLPMLDAFGRPLRIGQRVTWALSTSCGRCPTCRRGLPQKCERLVKYGHEPLREGRELLGGLAETCQLVEGTFVVPLPDELDDAVACTASCAGATVASGLRLAEGCRDEVVLVHGAGAVGLYACAMASRAGARAVIAVDVDPARLDLARAFGASHAVRSGDPTLRERVAELSGGRGVDTAFEASGATEAIAEQIQLMATGGVLLLVGSVFPAPSVALDPELVVRRHLTIRGVHSYAPRDLLTAHEFLRSAPELPFERLIGARFPLEAANEAIAEALRGSAPRIALGASQG